ncbi:hypothetical protein FRC00_005210 [Tulasnella sp. 408]|nr:hypothetical protein FRC00_005210 [Tulasnella sp. 408]
MQDQPNRSYTLDINNKNAEKDHERQVTNSQAALWLLEMAPSREDQLIAVRFLYTAPREACAAVFTNWERLQLIISLTLQTFDIWRSQPNEKTQETVQHFGRALCHVLPQTREGMERWKELIPPVHSRRLGLGERFLRELGSFEQTPNLSDDVGEEYALQIALLRTLILTKEIPIETYRWTDLKFLIRKEDPNSQLLGLWAKLMYKGFGHSEKYHLRRFPSASAAMSRKGRDSVKRDVAENDFPLALACGVQTLKSVERQAAPDNMVQMVLDAVEVYTACVQKTKQLAEGDRLHPASQGLVADAMTGFMTYFKKSPFLNPPERQLFDFIVSALQLIRSIHNSGYAANLDDAALDGLWYALDSIISAIDSSSEADQGSFNDVVIETLEFVSGWLPVKYGVYSPMVGLEAHSQIIEYITWHLVGEFQKSEGRVVHLMYKNRFRWFTQASSALRTAWIDAGLGSHLVDALRRPDSWKNTALLVRILEDITEMSMEWSRRLVDDNFLASVADVILNFDRVEDDNPVRRRCIQCRLTRALLSAWRHCSAITEIKWPKERMLLAINSASSATEWLLGRDATQVGPEASPNVALGKDAIVDIRNNLQLFFDWTVERLPQSALIGGDASQAISALRIQRTDGESPPASRFRVSRTCSRESYIENNLL